MAKKAKISQLYNPASMASMIAQATGQTAAQPLQPQNEPVFEVVEVAPKIKRVAQKAEKKPRNITKQIGRPKKYTAELERHVYTLMIRKTHISKLEKLSNDNQSVSDVLDKILEKYFSN